MRSLAHHLHQPPIHMPTFCTTTSTAIVLHSFPCSLRILPVHKTIPPPATQPIRIHRTSRTSLVCDPWAQINWNTHVYRMGIVLYMCMFCLPRSTQALQTPATSAHGVRPTRCCRFSVPQSLYVRHQSSPLLLFCLFDACVCVRVAKVPCRRKKKHTIFERHSFVLCLQFVRCILIFSVCLYLQRIC